MSAYCGLSRWRTLAPNPVASGLILPVQNARCAAASVRDEGAKMLDDDLRRGVRARLSEKRQRAAAVLLQTTLAMAILVGCGVASRPADGHLDLPHFASQAPSKEIARLQE